jgi:tetratricopeptide (TPR) repeat protein
MREASDRFTRQQVYDAAAKLLLAAPEDPELLWRFARAAYDLSQEPSTPTPKKKELLNEALRSIRDAKVAGRNNNDIFRWSGIILSEVGQYAGTTEYIKNAFVIRDDWEQATHIDPNDASALHLLGRWHYDVASMGWITRKAAAAFFAEPPTATYQEAKEFFERAESISPGFWKSNQVMLAQTEKQLGNKAEAIKWAASALNIPVRSTDDAKAHEDATKLLMSLDPKVVEEWKKAQAAKHERALKDAEARAKQL